MRHTYHPPNCKFIVEILVVTSTRLYLLPLDCSTDGYISYCWYLTIYVAFQEVLVEQC
jgi:hypothetical protein